MKQLCFLGIFILVPQLVIAQGTKVPVLEREISLSMNNEPVHEVLDAISKKADFVFSYNPEAIDANTLVSLNIRQKSVRYALNTIFDGTVKYKVRGKYIILQKDELYAGSLKNSKQNMSIEGYITETGSGQKISEATVYNKELLASVTTDKYGYFKIELPPDKKNAELHISKDGYSDTLIAQINGRKNYLSVELSANKNESAADSTLNKSHIRNLSFSEIRSNVTQWFISKKLWINSLNIKDTVFREVQVSFLPNISTNKLFTGNAVNSMSFNIIAGYTQEINGFEIGGIQNIVRNDARYCQISGIGNIVGGSFVGFQGAGIYNIIAGSLDGVQAAGIFNITRNNVEGGQIAGVWNNANGSLEGAQVSGVYNVANILNGTQISGVLNVVNKDSGACQVSGVTNIAGKTFDGPQISGVNNIANIIDGVQIGGVLNTATELSGSQIAGVLNIASKTDGTQIAGVLNCSGRVEGIQISGCVNQASYVNGMQISLVNFTDSCIGIPIGLFSFVRNGYHKIEISTDEIFYSNIAFRTGIKQFHNIFIAGIRPDNFKNPLWTFGYGLGSTFGKENNLLYDIDISVQLVNKGKFSVSTNDLYKLYFGIEKKIFSKTSLSAGVTYNLLVSDVNTSGFKESFDKLSPYTFSNVSNNRGLNFKTWLGGKIALRFL